MTQSEVNITHFSSGGSSGSRSVLGYKEMGQSTVFSFINYKEVAGRVMPGTSTVVEESEKGTGGDMEPGFSVHSKQSQSQSV